MKKTRIGLAAALLALSACSSSSQAPVATPSSIAGALTSGLIAYIADGGVGVIDPNTGKATVLAPLPAGGVFRTSGPVWGPAPDTNHPVIYFSIHDDRPAESRSTTGVVPYDWLFRVDPFTGVTEALAASADFVSEGPIGLAATARYLAFSVGCCSDYEVDTLDLTHVLGPLVVAAKPPAQAALFTEGASPGAGGLVIVRAFAGGWYFLDPARNVLNPFPLALGADDGPVDISPDGKSAVVSLLDNGAAIYPFHQPESPKAITPIGSAAAPGTPSGSAPQSPGPTPRRVNSKLPHADGVAWSPDGKRVALAVLGEVEVYDAAGADGTGPIVKYLSGASVTGIAWSEAMPDLAAATITAGAGPGAAVDALLAATKLPAAADSPQARLLTKVYIWQYDSSKTGSSTLPVATVTDPTPAFLAANPPLAAMVDFHHWSAAGTWPLLGGCYRYRVIVAGSVPPTASTVSLGNAAPCKAS